MTDDPFRADPRPNTPVFQAALPDRGALLLIVAGAGIGLLAALVLWQHEGAAIFLSAAGGMILGCL